MKNQRQTVAIMPDISVRPLLQQDLNAADRIMRVAFGTFIGLPEPSSFMGDADYVRTRWHADPSAAFAAEVGGEIVGSNFATNWGSVGFFGPLTIRPDLWDRGIGTRLMEPVLECFGRWNTQHAGLFTFPHSQKHIGLYQKFGFWPRYLTALMSKPIAPGPRRLSLTKFSAFEANERKQYLGACHELTDAVFDGLDVRREIEAVAAQKLGDTLLLVEGSTVNALAVCHCGPGSEAGSGACYIKFAATRPGPMAAHSFTALLSACEELAASQGVSRVVAGMNTARHEAYQLMMASGFRTDRFGIAMQRPNTSGYNREGIFVIDDWR